MNSMKTFKMLIMAGATAASLIFPRVAIAVDTTPQVVVVPQNDRDLLRDLRGAPDDVKTLILNFDQTRDQFLRQQRLLLIKLHNATTPEEREEIRDELQANRADFLADLKTFRQQLRDDLKALAGKLNPGEFQRIIAAAKAAATDTLHHHRGQ